LDFFSPKKEKLMEFTLEKNSFPQIFAKKMTKFVGKIK